MNDSGPPSESDDSAVAVAQAREAYALLSAKVDAFFVQAQQTCGDAMQCASGCHDCCQAGLTLTPIEAEAFVEGLDAMAPSARAALVARIQASDPPESAGVGDDTKIPSGPGSQGARCPVLDAHGRCTNYAYRPLVCRSHGLPIRFTEDSDAAAGASGPGAPHGASKAGSGPKLTVVRSCHLNFRPDGPERAPARAILDQSTLSSASFAVNRLYTEALGYPADMRLTLRELIDAAGYGDTDADEET